MDELSERRLHSVLTQLVSDSHKSKLQQLKQKREIRRQKSIKRGIVESDNASTNRESSIWETPHDLGKISQLDEADWRWVRLSIVWCVFVGVMSA